MPILSKSKTARCLIIFGLTVAMTACGGGASNPPEAQAATGQGTTPANETPVNTGDSMASTDNPPDTSSATGNPTDVDLSTPVFCNADKNRLEEVMLARINAARAEARACGNTNFPAVASVKWNSKLQIAAEVHSLDMTTHNFFDHTGSDGSSVTTRADAQMYEWRAIGENIAAGQLTAQEVVEGWLASDGHCRNLMNSSYTEIAVACLADENADYNRYWTNVLGAPLR